MTCFASPIDVHWAHAARRSVCTLALLWAVCGCGAPRLPPRLQYRYLESRAVGESLGYAVYEPPGRSRKERLPLVVFLHGAGDHPDCFDKARLGQRLDEAIGRGRVPPAVIALPEGDLSFWENEAAGPRRYRDWVLYEMLPAVRSEYNAGPCPERCHIMGNSMGGYGAMRFVYEDPGHFASVTAISAPIFDTEQMLDFRDSFWWGLIVPIDRIWGEGRDARSVSQDDPYLHWHERADLTGLKLLLTWGLDDHRGIIANNERFVRYLRERGVRFSAQSFPGGHDWESWSPVIEKALAQQVSRE